MLDTLLKWMPSDSHSEDSTTSLAPLKEAFDGCQVTFDLKTSRLTLQDNKAGRYFVVKKGRGPSALYEPVIPVVVEKSAKEKAPPVVKAAVKEEVEINYDDDDYLD